MNTKSLNFLVICIFYQNIKSLKASMHNQPSKIRLWSTIAFSSKWDKIKMKEEIEIIYSNTWLYLYSTNLFSYGYWLIQIAWNIVISGSNEGLRSRGWMILFNDMN